MEQSRSTTNRGTLATAAKVLLALALLAGFVMLVRAMPVEQLLTWLTAQIQAMGFWGPVAFGALFVGLTLSLIPATPVTLAAGAVFGTGVGAVTTSGAPTVPAATA